MAEVASGPRTRDVPLLVRIGSIEEKFEHFERKTDRIESMLNELIRNQSSASQSSDDRVEKIVTDKLETIKDQQREYKTGIESLQKGRQFNLVGSAVVLGAMFTVFAYFSNQSQQANRDLVASESNLVKLQFESDITPVKSDITAIKAEQSKHDDDLKDYRTFKDLVLAQNATSIQDRKDQADGIKKNGDLVANLTTEVRSLETKSDQRATEIETQFRLDGQVRNIQFSDQQRKNSELQNSVREIGGKLPAYPVGPFYQPNVSQHQGGDTQ